MEARSKALEAEVAELQRQSKASHTALAKLEKDVFSLVQSTSKHCT